MMTDFMEDKTLGKQYELSSYNYIGEKTKDTGKVLCYDENDSIFEVITNHLYINH